MNRAVQLLTSLVIAVLLTGAVPGVWAQNPNAAKFPTAIATDSDLLVAENIGKTTLSGNIDGATLTVVVADGSKIIPPTACWVDSELLRIASKIGNTLTVESGGRGFDRTTAAAHLSGATVWCGPVAHQHNQLAAEIKAMQAEIPLCSVMSELTIDAGGSITVTRPGCYRVDTFSNGATDDLTTINCPVGARITLMAEDDARTVIITPGAAILIDVEYSINSLNDSMQLLCKSANTVIELSRSGGL